MAIIDTNCTCGEKVTVLSGKDTHSRLRKDGKQVVYTGEPRTKDGKIYDIFRCRSCTQMISKTVPAASYEQ